MGATFDPTTDANDWERVLGVLSERCLLYDLDLELDKLGLDYPWATAPLPDRCAAALVVLEAHEQEQKEIG